MSTAISNRKQELVSKVPINFAAIWRRVSVGYVRSGVVDRARLPSRICSVVNSPPQTLHRQPGEAKYRLPGAACLSVLLARTNSLPQWGHAL